MCGKYNRLGIGLMFIFLAGAIPSLLSRNAHEIQAIIMIDITNFLVALILTYKSKYICNPVKH